MTNTIAFKQKARLYPECIWMQAKVVSQKRCRHGYACAACPYDKAMVRIALRNRRLRKQGRGVPQGRGGRIVFWKEKLRERAPNLRPCLHAMKGKIPFRTCINDYRCGNCEFDQYFDDQHLVHAVIQPVDEMDIHGFKIPQGYYLHPGHTWAKVEEGAEVRIGMDDFCRRLLGPLDEIQVPLIGKTVRQGTPGIKMRRGNQTAGLISPVSGVVTAVNRDLLPDLSGKTASPYAQGWVMRVHTQDLRGDLKRLMIGEEAESFLQQEVDRLYQVIETECGPLAADGGQLGDDICGNLPEKPFQRLVRKFLDR